MKNGAQTTTTVAAAAATYIQSDMSSPDPET